MDDNLKNIKNIQPEMILSNEKIKELIKPTTNILLNQYQPPTIPKFDIIRKPETVVNYSNCNVQNNSDNSTGFQNISSNSGMSIQDFTDLIGNLRDIFDLLPDSDSQEANEALDQVKEEVEKNVPKKGIVKGLCTYLSNMVKKAIDNPVATFKGLEYITEKAPDVIDK
ncbi:MAG: hypothetical protein ACYDG2_23165, partial [Ruminiclostridium sp.]